MAQQPKPPSVLIVMTDQQKATASHLYGSPFGETPSMQRLMENGTLYDLACALPLSHLPPPARAASCTCRLAASC